MVLMDVANVGVVPGSSGIVVVLREKDGKRLLVLEIGPMEANAIAMAIEGVEPPRPLTHDLLSNVIEELHHKVSSVAVVNLKNGTFFGQITLKGPDGTTVIDSRPSDGIALALRQGAPIYAADRVLSEAGISVDDEEHIVH